MYPTRLALLTALLLALPLFALGCDSDDEDEATDDTQTYTVNFTALNGSGVDATGSITVSDDDDLFTTDDDRFIIGIDADGLDDVTHPMHIHAGSSCPDASNDANNDGLISVPEGASSYGEIVVPLDSNLLDAEANDFPSGTALVFESNVDLNDFVDVYDAFGEEENLDIQTRTVIIHGVDALPGDAADDAAAATLPVACGTIAPA